MMEVRSPTLQNIGTTRHGDKMFGPEGRTPSVCTGLSLAIPAGENQSTFIGVEHLPSVSSPPASLASTVGGYESTSMPSLVGFGRNETVTLSSQATVGGNENMAHMLPPDIGLSSRIPVVVVGNRTTPVRPWNASTEAALQNLGSSRAFDNSLPRDGVNARPPVTAASDTKTTRVDIGNDQLNIATQLISQEDLNDVYNGGETQQVHNNEVGLDNTQLPFAGETQPVYDQEDFDDSVILQNDTLTASTLPLTTGDQSISLGVDAQPLQDFVKAPAIAPINSGGMEVLNQDGADALGNSSAWKETKASTGETETSPVVKGPNERVLLMAVPTVTEHPKLLLATTGEQLGLTEANKKEDSNKRILVTEVLTVTEHTEVQPAATRAQLGHTETSKNEGFNTPEPRGISYENVASPIEKKLHDREGKGEEGNLPKDGEAEKDVKDDVNGTAKVLSEEDIQAIKGRHVMKKFGRKNYKGEVVDYDCENQWFKVVYEDGDQEDLDLVEVKEILLIKEDLDLVELKEILLSEETSAKTSGAKRKRSHREGGDQDQPPSKSKMCRKDHTETPNKKRRMSKKLKGTPKKEGAVRTKRSQPGKPPRSKSKGLKSTEIDMKSSEMPESGLETKPKKKGSVRTKKSPRSKSKGLKSTETDIKSLELPESSLETKPDEILNVCVYENPVQSQTSGGKRKRNSGVQVGTSIQDKKTGSKAKGAGKKRTGNARTSTKGSAKKGGRKATPKKSSAKRKGTRHGSLLKLTREESKVDKTLNVRAGKKQKDTEKLKGKRLKSDGSEDDVFTGKAVEKDFGGISFSGVVTKYNQKTGYYKVKYEDGDQEDLEFDELKAVLVQ